VDLCDCVSVVCVDSALALCCGLGRAIGMFIGDTLFQSLQSAAFCNTYLRVIPSDTGMLSLGCESFHLHFLLYYQHPHEGKYGYLLQRGFLELWLRPPTLVRHGRKTSTVVVYPRCELRRENVVWLKFLN